AAPPGLVARAGHFRPERAGTARLCICAAFRDRSRFPARQSVRLSEERSLLLRRLLRCPLRARRVRAVDRFSFGSSNIRSRFCLLPPFTGRRGGAAAGAPDPPPPAKKPLPARRTR